jgi:hypothetical protein
MCSEVKGACVKVQGRCSLPRTQRAAGGHKEGARPPAPTRAPPSTSPGHHAAPPGHRLPRRRRLGGSSAHWPLEATPPQAMPYTYVPAQYIPADEMLVRVPRQLLGPVRRQGQAQDQFAQDQEASADTAYGAAPVGSLNPHP